MAPVGFGGVSFLSKPLPLACQSRSLILLPCTNRQGCYRCSYVTNLNIDERQRYRMPIWIHCSECEKLSSSYRLRAYISGWFNLALGRKSCVFNIRQENPTVAYRKQKKGENITVILYQEGSYWVMNYPWKYLTLPRFKLCNHMLYNKFHIGWKFCICHDSVPSRTLVDFMNFWRSFSCGSFVISLVHFWYVIHSGRVMSLNVLIY